jgi:hypothetical protein
MEKKLGMRLCFEVKWHDFRIGEQTSSSKKKTRNISPLFLFFKKGTTRKIYLLQESKTVAQFYIWNGLWEAGFLPLIFFILEDGLLSFYVSYTGHYLKDSLHITQFSSNWQLAPFYKRGTIFDSQVFRCFPQSNIETSIIVLQYHMASHTTSKLVFLWTHSTLTSFAIDKLT